MTDEHKPPRPGRNIHVPLPWPVVDALVASAGREDRPLRNQAAYLIRRSLEGQGYLPPESPPEPPPEPRPEP